MRATVGAALVLCGALVPAPAIADAIDPDWEPPDCSDVHLDCPEGSAPVALGHSSCPSTCAPTAECRSASDCREAYGETSRCVPTRFCVGVASSGPGMSASVEGECDPQGQCPGADPEAQCSVASRCTAPPPAPSAAPAHGGCAGCAARPGGAAGSSIVALAVALALARRRRR